MNLLHEMHFHLSIIVGVHEPMRATIDSFRYGLFKCQPTVSCSSQTNILAFQVELNVLIQQLTVQRQLISFL